jgi:hypothetical protein
MAKNKFGMEILSKQKLVNLKFFLSFHYWAYDDYRNEANFDVSWHTIYCNLGQFTLIIGECVNQLG